MPFIQVNGRQIFYDIFNDNRSERVPIVLIHDSAQTGRACWRQVTHLLAHRYRVIVPDCRGQGQSCDPGDVVNNKELAKDLATLVRKLGYQSAHFVGHNSGSSIALAALVDYPEMVQSIILQNAPATIDASGYSSADLAQIHCPVFVIHSSNNPVDFPNRLEKQLVDNLRDCELWLPAKTELNFHDEQPSLWVERVLDFLDRQNDYVNAAWAMTIRGVTDLRREPGNRAERLSQALLGDVVQIFNTNTDWAWVQMERDYYFGWMHTAAIEPVSLPAIRAYQERCNAKVMAELLPTWEAAGSSNLQFGSDHPVEKLPFGIAVVVEEWNDDTAIVLLPNQRYRRVPRAGLLPAPLWPKTDEPGIAFTLQLIRRFVGVPYLWGGRSPFGFDCSGLAQAFLNFLGINAPRDADLQFRSGAPIDGAPLPGDLLFFGEADNPTSQRYENISHVAISLGDSEFIHANGTAWGVSYNSLDPQRPRYRAWLHDHLIGVRRFR